MKWKTTFPASFHRAICIAILFSLFGRADFLIGQEESTSSTLGKRQSSTKDKLAINWTSWRGSLGTGEATNVKPPVSWSEEENIRWKKPLPGLGHSTPIIWNQTVFVTSARPVGEKFDPIADNRPGSHHNLKVQQSHEFLVTAYDRKTGKELWTTVCEKRIPHEGGHISGSLASASPVTDGKKIYAFFGSAGLFALDFQGKIVWKKTFPKMHSKHGHGEGATPALWKDSLYINWDEEGQSFVMAIDTKSGKEKWKKQRNESTSWSSPIVEEVDNKVQLIIAGTNRVRGYDITNGEVLWYCSGLSANVVATPVIKDNILVVGSSYEIRSLMVLDLKGAKGDLTKSKHLLWKTNQKTPYIPSPLIYKNKLYFLRHYQGILSRADLKTGDQELGPFRLGGFREIYASPSAADGKIFVTSRSGATVVFDHENIPRVHSLNLLKDGINACLAFSGDMIFIRGEKYLYCIQEDK